MRSNPIMPPLDDKAMHRLLRRGVAEIIVEAVRGKEKGHGMDEPGFLSPGRAMYLIGG